MNFLGKGFLVWGIVILVLAAILFGLWMVLSGKPAFENRKKETAWGFGSIVTVFATILFIPMFLTQLDSAFISVAEGLQDKVAVDTKGASVEYLKGDVTRIIDNLLVEKQVVMTQEIEDQKILAIDNAVKYTESKSFRDTFTTTLKLFKVNEEQVLFLTEDEINQICYDAIEPYGAKAEENAIKIPSLKLFFNDIVNTSSLVPVSGVENTEVIEAAAKAISKRLSKVFVIVASVVASIIMILLLVIIFLLKEPKEKREEVGKREHLFEFDRPDKTTGKPISEEINQYN